jgi:hypothetical protein
MRAPDHALLLCDIRIPVLYIAPKRPAVPYVRRLRSPEDFVTPRTVPLSRPYAVYHIPDGTYDPRCMGI